jgi:hypothetical protein
MENIPVKIVATLMALLMSACYRRSYSGDDARSTSETIHLENRVTIVPAPERNPTQPKPTPPPRKEVPPCR